METVNKQEDNKQEASQSLPPEKKKVLKLVFLTVFLDILGFSIIFPMFPAMAEYYIAKDGNNIFLNGLLSTIDSVVSLTGFKGGQSQVILFGGVLGALYSLLQFIFAPIWGAMSDIKGRKPILIFTIGGLTFSYLLWIFAGSFTLLLVARLIGGLMAGNLSTVSAVASDITDTKNRSKAMAVIGIAFALGFIFGPAIGGISALVDLTQYFPGLVGLGLNPFSFPALLAFVFCGINFYLIVTKFKETLPDKGAKERSTRTSNPIKLLAPTKNSRINQVNWSYFLFITAFAGMEFTLTFLAVERLAYSPLDNGYMFIYIGFLIAMVQGGFVRRRANQIGERKVALAGLIILVPGLLWLAYTQTSFGLYGGLTFLAIGSAMIIPCLTALVSIYADESEQGRVLGIFRSLGSLGRVIGPILASLLYYRLGSGFPYLIGSVSLLLPVIVLARVKDTEK
jgi:MFS family permease